MARLTNSLCVLTAGLLALKQVQANIVTIYMPEPTDSVLKELVGNQANAIGVAGIDVAADEAMQYEATEVATGYALEGVTQTFSPTKFVSDSTYHYSQAAKTTTAGGAIAMVQDIACGPGDGDQLKCTEKGQMSVQGSEPTATTVAFVAARSPIFTITEIVPPLHTVSKATNITPCMAAMSLFIGFVSGFAYML
ncbi:hypothetical protein BDN70DRAFT_995109 [Pholiota conissans]|uniref:Uncharacterized protein n=1 Tax=Pholiota conissans TaxID=109636 RepID=A0A9P6CYE9_9AGAR|nr:hypothetical protein BDN70DRAFT_995109 [Pholiota conissans]